MKFYSTNNRNLRVSLHEAVTRGLAPDNGLFMPERIPALSGDFFTSIHQLSFREIALEVASAFLRDDVPQRDLAKMIEHTIQFDAPLAQIGEEAYALELFHGPTLAFKDFGARFMSQLLGYFANTQGREITILVATSGDTGSAVANGFLDVPGIRVVVLYPSRKVSEVQEKQFTTLGKNVTALEIDGTFDDCQHMVKQAFADRKLTDHMFLTSANSINIARLIPQSFYYFYGFSRLPEGERRSVVFSVPSGNFGNLTAGVLAWKMGLPVKHFVAATNINDIVPVYLETSRFQPRPSEHTISNAMDVGNPSNFARLVDLFGNDHDAMTRQITGYSFTDEQTSVAMREVYRTFGYMMDPHGAVGYLGLQRFMKEHDPECKGIFLETAHPGKFGDVVGRAVEAELPLPDGLQKFMRAEKKSLRLPADYEALRNLLQRA